MTIGDRVVNNVEPKDTTYAMVFQNYALYPHMSVYDNIGFTLKLAKVPKDEIDRRVREAAEVLELTSNLDRKPGQLWAASASALQWAGRSCASHRRS